MFCAHSVNFRTVLRSVTHSDRLSWDASYCIKYWIVPKKQQKCFDQCRSVYQSGRFCEKNLKRFRKGYSWLAVCYISLWNLTRLGLNRPHTSRKEFWTASWIQKLTIDFSEKRRFREVSLENIGHSSWLYRFFEGLRRAIQVVVLSLEFAGSDCFWVVPLYPEGGLETDEF